jgi:hypothetical protein
LKQNLMQICCSFTSIILTIQYNCKTALTQHWNDTRKKWICACSSRPLGRLVHSGYRLWHLAAHTSGLHATFNFRELLGSTSYKRLPVEKYSEFCLSHPNRQRREGSRCHFLMYFPRWTEITWQWYP